MAYGRSCRSSRRTRADQVLRREGRFRQDFPSQGAPGRLGRILETSFQADRNRFGAADKADVEQAPPPVGAIGGVARSRPELRDGPASDYGILFAATCGAPQLQL